MATIKTGYLQKHGGILRKVWKRKHCVLYQYGDFKIFDGPIADFVINVKTEVIKIDVGRDCGDIELPTKGSDVDSMFAIVTSSRSYYMFAASDQDCREWVEALRNTTVQATYGAAPPPYNPMQYNQPVGMAPGVVYRPPYQQIPGTVAYPPGYIQPRPPVYGQPMYPQQTVQTVYAPQQTVYAPQQTVYRQVTYQQPVQVPGVILTQGVQHHNYNHNYGRRHHNRDRNMLLAGGAGLLGGYMLGSALSDSHHDSGFGFGGCDDDFGGGGFGGSDDFGGCDDF